MRKLPKTIAVAVTGGVAVAGCTGHPSPAHGTVTGIFLEVGGPSTPAQPFGPRRPLAGRVIAVSITGGRFVASTGKSGRFTMLLPPGTYHLTGYSPNVQTNGHEMRCLSVHPIHVKAGKSLPHIEVYCSIP